MFDMYPLQLYSSALIFTSKQSMIRSVFEKEIPPWVNGLPHALDIHHNSPQIHIGHTNGISFVALSLDNKQLASGSEDGSIRLWTTATGRLEQTLQGHEKEIGWISYVQQGTRLASCTYRGESVIIIWSPKTGGIEQIVEVESNIQRVCLSHDGQLLAICLVDGGEFKVWDFNIGGIRDVIRVHENVRRAEFSADDGMLALASRKGGIEVVFTSNGTRMGMFGAVNGDEICESLAFSLTGDLLAAGYFPKGVRIWSTSSRQLVFTSDEYNGHHLMFFPDGSRLICLSPWYQRTVQVWDYLNNCLDTNYQGFRGPVALSNDGTRSAMVSKDGRAVVWNISTAVIERSFRATLAIWASGGDSAILFLDDGQHLVYSDYGKIELWDVDKGDLVYSIKSSMGKIYKALFSPDGRYLASVAENRTITIWNIASKTLLWRFRREGYLQSFSPTSLYLVLKTNQGTELWSLSTRDLHVCLPIPVANYAEFMSNENQLMVFDEENTDFSLWNTTTGERLDNLQGDMCLLVGAEKLFPNGRQLATADHEGTIRIWDLPTSTLLHTFAGGLGDRIDRLFYPSSRDYILSLTGKKLIRWNIDTAFRQWTVTAEPYLSSVSFSENGKQMAVVLGDTKISILDASTGKLLQNLEFPSRPREVQFSSNQQYLETNKGTLSLDQDVSGRPSLSKHVFLTDAWFTINGENMLWLPALYRPTYSTVHDGKIAFVYGYTGEIVLYDIATASSQSLLPGPDSETA